MEYWNTEQIQQTVNNTKEKAKYYESKQNK